uniref:Uncharacterized protein n=1 Tax=Chenopodium quinoa TaxID=63459 RepID=A0A803M2U5_CHEQI
MLTLRAFQNSQSKCDNAYHTDNSLVVALSTGWYNSGARCGKMIAISGNGKTVKAKVVDECDSTKGCDAGEGYHPPCGYNIVAASKAVWKALGVPQIVPNLPPQSQPPLSNNFNPKKRPLDHVYLLQSSPYFKMRAFIRDLRPLFLQVLRAPDFQNCEAARRIQESIDNLSSSLAQMLKVYPMRNHLCAVCEVFNLVCLLYHLLCSIKCYCRVPFLLSPFLEATLVVKKFGEDPKDRSYFEMTLMVELCRHQTAEKVPLAKCNSGAGSLDFTNEKLGGLGRSLLISHHKKALPSRK